MKSIKIRLDYSLYDAVHITEKLQEMLEDSNIEVELCKEHLKSMSGLEYEEYFIEIRKVGD